MINSVIMPKTFSLPYELITHQTSSIKDFYDVASSNTYPSPDFFLLMTNTGTQGSWDWLVLGFLECEKINGVLNVDIPLILAVIIAELNLTVFVMDDRSSWNILYADMLELLGIQQADLNLYDMGDLLAFNDSMTRPREW